MNSLCGKRALVIGLGESGLGAAMLLKFLGAEVRVTDSNVGEEVLRHEEALTSEGVEVELGAHSRNFCQGVDFAVLSPGIPGTLPLLKWLGEDGVPVIGEFEWASRFLQGRIIAITGSNGKSTTATLVYHILKEQGLRVRLAGNIGRSVSRVIFESGSGLPEDTPEFWVLEASSFQLETLETFKPWISMILNLTPNHLDRYSSMEEYIEAKKNIFRNQDARDWVILNRAIASHAPMLHRGGVSPGIVAKGASPNTLGRGSTRVRPQAPSLFINSGGVEPQGVFVEGCKVKFRSGNDEEELFSTEDLSLRGSHNLENAMFAACAARLCGVSGEVLRRVLGQFRGLEHRQEVFGVWEGVRWVNDSKATSVDAVRKALEAFEPPILWVAGGRFKGGDFESLKPAVAQKVKEAYFYGEARSLLARHLEGACPTFLKPSLKDAIEEIRSRARPGDTVLFSPGCASFDQFKNFEERGRFLKSEVERHFAEVTV